MTARERFPFRPCVTAYLPWEAKSGLWYFHHEWRFNSVSGEESIPAQFETDFGSIPPWLRSFVDDDDPKLLAPFLVHDKRYKEAKGERQAADDELYDNCILCGTSRLKAWLIRRAVGLGGGSHWGK